MGFGKFLLLKGSLRKWYLAEQSGDTLTDLTQQEYDNALKLLFSLLEIPDENRKYFYMDLERLNKKSSGLADFCMVYFEWE